MNDKQMNNERMKEWNGDEVILCFIFLSFIIHLFVISLFHSFIIHYSFARHLIFKVISVIAANTIVTIQKRTVIFDS